MRCFDSVALRSDRFKFSIDNRKVACDEKVMRNIFRRMMHNTAKFAENDSDVEVTGGPQGSRYRLLISAGRMW